MQQASHLPSPALRADIYCPLCSAASSALLDGGQLERQGVLSFVQLHQCGHTYCTRCFELFLLASARVNHSQSVRCLAPGCQHDVLVPQWPVDENNMAFEIRECRFEPPNGTPRVVLELRISVKDLRERISPGQFVIRSSMQAAMSAWQEQYARNTVTPIWVFVAQPTQFERLLGIVHERRCDGRLFYRVPNEGRPLDLQLLRLLVPGSQPPGYSASSRASFHPEAKQSNEADERHTGPPQEQAEDVNQEPEQQPQPQWDQMPENTSKLVREARPYCPPGPSYRADNTSSSRPPQTGRADVAINVKQSVAYGVAVDSLLGEFLLHLRDPPARGRFFY